MVSIRLKSTEVTTVDCVVSTMTESAATVMVSVNCEGAILASMRESLPRTMVRSPRSSVLKPDSSNLSAYPRLEVPVRSGTDLRHP